MTVIPPPPLPSPDAEADVWLRYTQELDNYRAATARLHAQAQADTAAAMDRAAAAQERLIDEMGKSPKPTREELIWQAVLAHPQVTRLTDLNVVTNCGDLVEAYLSRNPGAV